MTDGQRLEEQVARLTNELEFERNQLRRMRDDRDNLREKNGNQARTINGQREELDRLTISIAGLQVTNTELGGEVTNLGNERDEYALRLREAGKSIDALQAERAGLENRLSDSLIEWTQEMKRKGAFTAAIQKAMSDFGIKFGWVDDEELTLLEQSAEGVTAHISDLRSELDNIRTGR